MFYDPDIRQQALWDIQKAMEQRPHIAADTMETCVSASVRAHRPAAALTPPLYAPPPLSPALPNPIAPPFETRSVTNIVVDMLMDKGQQQGKRAPEVMAQAATCFGVLTQVVPDECKLSALPTLLLKLQEPSRADQQVKAKTQVRQIYSFCLLLFFCLLIYSFVCSSARPLRELHQGSDRARVARVGHGALREAHVAVALHGAHAARGDAGPGAADAPARHLDRRLPPQALRRQDGRTRARAGAFVPAPSLGDPCSCLRPRAFFPPRCVCVFSPRAAARRALAPPASRPPLSFRRQYRDQAIATLESAAAGSPIATECTNVVANFCAVANSGAVCNVVSTMMRLMRSSSSSADAAIMCVSQIAKEAGNKAGERLDELLDLLQGELTTGRDDSSDEKNERRANCAFSFRLFCLFVLLFVFVLFNSLDPVRPGVLSAPRDSSRRSPA